MRVEWHTTSYDQHCCWIILWHGFWREKCTTDKLLNKWKEKNEVEKQPNKEMDDLYTWLQRDQYVHSNIHIIHISSHYIIYTYLKYVATFMSATTYMSAQQTNQYRTSQSPLCEPSQIYFLKPPRSRKRMLV